MVDEIRRLQRERERSERIKKKKKGQNDAETQKGKGGTNLDRRVSSGVVHSMSVVSSETRSENKLSA